MGIEKAIVLGHSMGGKTAMYLAGIAPEKVHKLLVADIGPKAYPPHHKIILDALVTLYNSQISSRTQAEEILSVQIKSAGVRQFLLKNLYRKTPDTFGFRANIPVLSVAMNAIGEALPKEFKFEKPSIFLSGAQSDYILPEDHMSILVQFPEAQFKSVSKAGHWLHAENPTEFLAYTLDFLRR
jgi:pimeloyl-ACP methyl ester carboxylesterase